MEEDRRRWRDGREVPGAGDGNTIKWIDISVPSPSPSEDNVVLPSLEEDYASSRVIGEPPISFVWRINKTTSNVLEVLQLCSISEFPLTGIRFAFAHAVSPFSFPFLAQELSASGTLAFFIYALTLSGVVYVLDLSNALAYKSGSVIPLIRVGVVVDVRPYLNNEAQVTSVTASPGFLFLGRSDGCVSCFQPFLSPNEPSSGFNQELRDDTGFLRRWGLVRGTDVAAVTDLSILEFSGRVFINVLHADWKLRIWDILTCTKVLCSSIAAHNLFIPLRLWVGNADFATHIIPVAVLFKDNLVNVITVFFVVSAFKKSISFYLHPSRNIRLQGGALRDVRFTSDKIWILKADELISQMLTHKSSNNDIQSYMLQEEYISEQLFLSPTSSLHALRLTTQSLFSSAKDRIVGFVSSIFLGRLLCLGTFQDVALRLTLRDYNKHWSDYEFQSLSLDELKSEILSLIEQEVTGETTISVFDWWESFCSSYLYHWRNNNEPRTLLIQSDFIGLVRNNSVSLFFGLENAEHSLGGPSSEHSNLTSLGSGMSQNENEILLEVLKCTLKISKQLGTAPCAMYYESVIGKPVIPSDETLSRLVNILEIDILLYLSDLCQRAGSWEKVFTIMEKYLQKHLVPKKFRHNNNGDELSDICSSILVQATSQFAKVMFESAFDIVLLLSYLLNISEHVNMSEQDISKLRLKLLPMIQDIVSEWLIILFFVNTPADSTSMGDCSFKLSSLQIDSSIDKISWNKMLGKCGFSLAYIFLFGDPSFIVDIGFDLRYLPNSQIIGSLVQNFISWICYSKTGEGSASLLRRSSELTLMLISNGQADVVERILEVVEGSLRREKIFEHSQDTSGDWCLVQHLRGCCLLDQVQRGACGTLREEKISGATRCFFRASSGEGSWKALHSLAIEAGFSNSSIGASISDGEKSCATWKLHYYEWAKQIFERYNISEGASQFACAALEQVDEAISFMEISEKVHVTATLGLKKRSLTSRRMM